MAVANIVGGSRALLYQLLSKQATFEGNHISSTKRNLHVYKMGRGRDLGDMTFQKKALRIRLSFTPIDLKNELEIRYFQLLAKRG